MHAAESDPIGRRAGQYARATVLRLRMRTLVGLGVLAVCTALLGRINGLHAPLFLASEVALLASMFAISRYILPVVERRDRGAMAEEQVGALLDGLPQEKWRVVHDVSLGRGNVDHIVIGPPGVFTIETKSHPGPIRASRVHGAMLSQAQAQGRAIAWVTGVEAEPLIVFSRAWVDRPGARRKGVRSPSGPDAGGLPRKAPDDPDPGRRRADPPLARHGRSPAAPAGQDTRRTLDPDPLRDAGVRARGPAGVACRDGRSHQGPPGRRQRHGPTRRRSGSRRAPGLPAVLQTLAWTLAPTWFMDSCAKRLGEMFTVTFAPSGMKFVMVSDPESVKAIFTAPRRGGPLGRRQLPGAPGHGGQLGGRPDGSRAHAPAQAPAAALPRRADEGVRRGDRRGHPPGHGRLAAERADAPACADAGRSPSR